MFVIESNNEVVKYIRTESMGQTSPVYIHVGQAKDGTEKRFMASLSTVRKATDSDAI